MIQIKLFRKCKLTKCKQKLVIRILTILTWTQIAAKDLAEVEMQMGKSIPDTLEKIFTPDFSIKKCKNLKVLTTQKFVQ